MGGFVGSEGSTVGPMDELAVTDPVGPGFDVCGLDTAVLVGTVLLLEFASEWATKMPMIATSTAIIVAQAAQTNTFGSNVIPLMKSANPDDRLGGRLYRKNAGRVRLGVITA